MPFATAPRGPSSQDVATAPCISADSGIHSAELQSRPAGARDLAENPEACVAQGRPAAGEGKGEGEQDAAGFRAFTAAIC